jgi:Uma2 family endonuclease
MATLIAPFEQKVHLHGVSWETYERLLAEHNEAPGTHFIYDQGELEIMVLSSQHERPNSILETLVKMIAVELDLDYYELRSTTFKRERLQKGFEPDAAFFFGPSVAAAEKRDAAAIAHTNFAPDLIIEVEISTPCVDRLPIFAAFGVPELWRYANSRVIFYRLENGEYVEATHSLALPPVTAADITRLLDDRTRMRAPQWTRHVQEWARQLR